MIVKNNTSNVEFGNVEQGGEFKIRNSAKAFAILSSGLYKNKVRAIIRELSCNAVDSHTASGNIDKPFEVHLPTSLEPHFSVRDYGTGLSHEEVVNVYTTYFESTKAGSNEFIGALGLGSKSPFSYTNNFSVTAIKGGKKNIYTAYINQNGVPEITLMTSMDSDEESGVEVSFSVKNDDFYKFNQEATEVFSVFKNHPKITGNYRKKELTLEPVCEGVDLVKSYGFDGAHAVMGNIMYPISVPNEDTNLGQYAKLTRNNLIIRFDIGELDIAASREDLSYIPETIEAIKNKLMKISSFLEKNVKEKIDAEKNAWLRVSVINNLLQSSLYSVSTREYLVKTPLAFVSNGSVNTFFKLYEPDTEKFNISLDCYSRSYSGKLKLTNKSCDTNRTLVNGIIEENTQFYNTISITTKTKFLANPDNKRIASRIRLYAKSNMDSRQDIFVATPINKDKPMDFDGFLKSIHNPPSIVKIDDLPELPKTIRGDVAKGSVLISQSCIGSGYGQKWEEFDIDSIDKNLTYYYVTIKGKQIISKKYGTLSLSDYASEFDNVFIGDMSLRGIRIIGVREKALPDVLKTAKWVDFEDFIEKTLKKHLKSNSFYDTIAFHSLKEVEHFKDMIPMLTNKSPIVACYNKFKSVTPPSSYINQTKTRYLVKKFFDTEDFDTKYNSVSKIFGQAIAKYPLLPSNVRYSEKEHLVEYINLIDNYRGV